MKKTATCTTLMWLAVDEDGWGKLFKNPPTRLYNIWVGTGESEPKLFIPDAPKHLGRTWNDEATPEKVTYIITINNEE